jgi:hypothetical protein
MSASGASNSFSAKLMSSDWFSCPYRSIGAHIASTPSIRRGYFSASSNEIAPPPDDPVATVRRGLPTWFSNQSSTPIWSSTASLTTNPVRPLKSEAARA